MGGPRKSKVAIRVDASVRIGYGHFTRCSALAEELGRAGAEVHFLGAELVGSPLLSARDAGHRVSLLAGPSCGLDPTDLDAEQKLEFTDFDANQTLSALRHAPPDVLIVDHYSFGAACESILRTAGCRIVCIDDLANRAHDCDLLIDQSPGRASADYEELVPRNARRLLGPRFALLRSQFARARPGSLPELPRGKAPRVLVSMGGTDPGQVTQDVLDGLEISNFPANTGVRILMGSMAPGRQAVMSRIAKSRFECELLVNPPDVARCIAGCDIAVGSGGVSALERCCLGVPSLVVVVAENQRHGAASLAAAGAVIGVVERTEVREAVASLDPGLPGARAVSRAGIRLVDGRGPARASAAILELANA